MIAHKTIPRLDRTRIVLKVSLILKLGTLVEQFQPQLAFHSILLSPCAETSE
jgi:hypothetical protein